MFTEILGDTPAKRKIRRVINWHGLAGTGLPADGILEVIRGRKSTRYVVAEEFGSHGWFGRVFELRKVQGDPGTNAAETHYHVCVGPNPAGDRCECRGHYAHGRCCHLDAIRALLENGQIPDARVNPDADVGPVAGEDFGF